MISGITFDQQSIKAEDMAHFMKTFSADANGITRGCGITSDSNNMYMAEGYLLIQGREIKITGTQTVALNKVTTGEQYCRVVIEIDLSKSNTETVCNQLSIKTLTSSSGYPLLTQQDLEDYPEGKYQFLLAQYHTTVSGVDSFAAKAAEADATFMKKSDADSTYATKKDVESTYLKKSDADSKYITESDFSAHFTMSGSDLYITF